MIKRKASNSDRRKAMLYMEEKKNEGVEISSEDLEQVSGGASAMKVPWLTYCKKCQSSNVDAKTETAREGDIIGIRLCYTCCDCGYQWKVWPE